MNDEIKEDFCIENRRDLKEVVNILQNGSEENVSDRD